MTVGTGEIVKAVATMTMPDEVVQQSVWYWMLITAAPQSYALVLAAVKAEIEAFYAPLNAFLSDECSLTDVIAHVWEHDVLLGWHTGRLIGIDVLVDAFGAAADMLPHAVAGIITGFCEDVKTRSRKSIGGLADTEVTESTWNPSPLAALAASASEWLTARTVAGADQLFPVIPDKDGNAPYLLHTLTSAICGSQRQRKPGEGI